MKLAALGHGLDPVDAVGVVVVHPAAHVPPDAGHLALVPVPLLPCGGIEAGAGLVAELIVTPAARYDALLFHNPHFEHAAELEHRLLLSLRAGVGCLGPACVRNL